MQAYIATKNAIETSEVIDTTEEATELLVRLISKSGVVIKNTVGAPVILLVDIVTNTIKQITSDDIRSITSPLRTLISDISLAQYRVLDLLPNNATAVLIVGAGKPQLYIGTFRGRASDAFPEDHPLMNTGAPIKVIQQLFCEGSSSDIWHLDESKPEEGSPDLVTLLSTVNDIDDGYIIGRYLDVTSVWLKKSVIHRHVTELRLDNRNVDTGIYPTPPEYR